VRLQVRILSAILSLAALACATEPSWKPMVAELGRAQHAYPVRLRVESLGMRNADWWGKGTFVSNAEFHSALVDSIRNSGLFSEVVSEGEARYLLDVFIHCTKVHRDFAVDAAAKWTLIDLATRRVVVEKIIRTYDRIALGERRPGAGPQLRWAYQGAARNNIEQGLHLLAGLDLSDRSPQPSTP
jgi:hypothetical protein